MRGLKLATMVAALALAALPGDTPCVSAAPSGCPTPLPLAQTSARAEVPAFPGAEGFGAGASGGRGGRVLHVTNLRASGPGSLQAALDATGPRTIVFDVSGVVEGVPEMRHGDVTIAGQTSPQGVTLRGLMIQGDRVEEGDDAPLPKAWPSNFIVRHLRLRSPLADGSDGDALRLHHAKNGILDHLSLGNASDEAVQVSFASNITIQNCIIAETVGEHADLGGMLINYGDPRRGFPLTRLSIHHNLFSRIAGRLPELSRESPGNTGSVMEVEISNNVYYDPRFPIWMGMTSQTNCPGEGYFTDPIHYHANIVGNVFIQNPSREHSFGLLTIEGAGSPDRGFLPDDSPTRLFLSGNLSTLAPQASDWQLVYGSNDWREAFASGSLPFASGAPGFAASQRMPFPSISYTSSAQLTGALQSTVGAWPRDAMDKRLCGYLSAGFPSGPANANPAHDSLTLAKSSQPADDPDGDGMPSAWESSHGLNPVRADGNGVNLDGSYTNLEVYLNGLAASRIK